MKVGDLVVVKGTSPENLCTGVIVSTEPPAFYRGDHWQKSKQKVGVLWADGGNRIDWERTSWLEVISESR